MKIQQKGSEAQWAFTFLLEIYFFENKSFVPMQHPLINLTPQWWRSTGNLCINACISHINNFWVPQKLWNSKVSKVQPCMRAYLIAYKAARHITNYSSVVYNVLFFVSFAVLETLWQWLLRSSVRWPLCFLWVNYGEATIWKANELVVLKIGVAFLFL